jgi:hypothetical protein
MSLLDTAPTNIFFYPGFPLPPFSSEADFSTYLQNNFFTDRNGPHYVFGQNCPQIETIERFELWTMQRNKTNVPKFIGKIPFPSRPAMESLPDMTVAFWLSKCAPGGEIAVVAVLNGPPSEAIENNLDVLHREYAWRICDHDIHTPPVEYPDDFSKIFGRGYPYEIYTDPDPIPGSGWSTIVVKADLTLALQYFLLIPTAEEGNLRRLGFRQATAEQYWREFVTKMESLGQDLSDTASVSLTSLALADSA